MFVFLRVKLFSLFVLAGGDVSLLWRFLSPGQGGGTAGEATPSHPLFGAPPLDAVSPRLPRLFGIILRLKCVRKPP